MKPPQRLKRMDAAMLHGLGGLSLCIRAHKAHDRSLSFAIFKTSLCCTAHQGKRPFRLGGGGVFASENQCSCAALEGSARGFFVLKSSSLREQEKGRGQGVGEEFSMTKPAFVTSLCCGGVCLCVCVRGGTDLAI